MTATSQMTTSAHTGAPAAGRRVDWGRIVMVPLSVLFGLAAVLETVGLVLEGSAGDRSRWAVALLTGGQTLAFYALMLWAYLRRGPATATSRVVPALVAAPVATFLPFGLPFMATGAAGAALVTTGNLLLVAGLAWSLWSIRTLDRSLSVVPQARQLVDRGPYRWVRHPLYLGELVAMLGLALTLGGLLPLLGWGVLVLLQCYRAYQEERLLGAALVGYQDYAARTARVIPGLF